jgi:hypothetical protein
MRVSRKPRTSTVRAARAHFSRLSVSHSKSILYGGSVCAWRVVHGPPRLCLARTVKKMTKQREKELLKGPKLAPAEFSRGQMVCPLAGRRVIPGAAEPVVQHGAERLLPWVPGALPGLQAEDQGVQEVHRDEVQPLPQVRGPGTRAAAAAARRRRAPLRRPRRCSEITAFFGRRGVNGSTKVRAPWGLAGEFAGGSMRGPGHGP